MAKELTVPFNPDAEAAGLLLVDHDGDGNPMYEMDFSLVTAEDLAVIGLAMLEYEDRFPKGHAHGLLLRTALHVADHIEEGEDGL